MMLAQGYDVGRFGHNAICSIIFYDVGD